MFIRTHRVYSVLVNSSDISIDLGVRHCLSIGINAMRLRFVHASSNDWTRFCWQYVPRHKVGQDPKESTSNTSEHSSAQHVTAAYCTESRNPLARTHAKRCDGQIRYASKWCLIWKHHSTRLHTHTVAIETDRAHAQQTQWNRNFAHAINERNTRPHGCRHHRRRTFTRMNAAVITL